MRKLLTVALAASATLSLAVGPAVAQAPEAALKVTATPSKAGKTKKPKNVKLLADLTVNKPGTTVQTIQLDVSKGLAFSGKGFAKCNFDDLNADGPSVCPAKSKAGPVGEAHALAGTTPIDFTVAPYVENANSLLFYLVSPVAVEAIRGKITKKGTRLTITIPPNLRHPGLDASLTGLKQTFSGKVGKHYILSSTGCKGGKWKISGKLGFATDRLDGVQPPVPSISTSTTTKCKK